MSHVGRLRGLRKHALGLAMSALAFVGLAALSAPPAARAQEGTFEGQVVKLLEEGWGASIKSLTPAQEHFEAAEGLGGDHRAKLAMMLVNLKHRRYTAVDDLAGKLLEVDPAMIPAREARIWSLMLNKRYSAALVEMESLAKNFPASPSPAEDEQIIEATQFMGRLIGFLEGPGGDLLGKNLAGDHIKKIEALLNGTGRREAFAEGRKKVADQHAGVALDSEQLKSEEREAEERQKIVERERVAREKSSVGEEKAGIEELASKATRETTEAVGELEKQMVPLNAQFARLSADAGRVQSQMVAMDLELQIALQRANDNNSKKDPNQRNFWLIEADRVRFLIVNLQNQYAGLNAQATQVNGQRAALDAQRRTKIANYEADMKRLGKQAAVLTKTEKRLGQEEKKAEKPATGNTSRVQSASAKAAALSSYVEYPLEQEKQRLLESFRAKAPAQTPAPGSK